MSEYMFGLHQGHLTAKADQIAERHGAWHVNYTEPRFSLWPIFPLSLRVVCKLDIPLVMLSPQGRPTRLDDLASLARNKCLFYEFLDRIDEVRPIADRTIDRHNDRSGPTKSLSIALCTCLSVIGHQKTMGRLLSRIVAISANSIERKCVTYRRGQSVQKGPPAIFKRDQSLRKGISTGQCRCRRH
jgi:hypothetical protein